MFGDVEMWQAGSREYWYELGRVVVQSPHWRLHNGAAVFAKIQPIERQLLLVTEVRMTATSAPAGEPAADMQSIPALGTPTTFGVLDACLRAAWPGCALSVVPERPTVVGDKPTGRWVVDGLPVLTPPLRVKAGWTRAEAMARALMVSPNEPLPLFSVESQQLDL